MVAVRKTRKNPKTKKAVKAVKLKDMQDNRPKVRWGPTSVKNCWKFKYLDSIFCPDDNFKADVAARIAQAKKRVGQLRHVWSSKILPLSLKRRLYISGVCSILTYGAEAWRLDVETRSMLNGVNAQMLTHITNKTVQEEATAATSTIDIVLWIRVRRLKWVVGRAYYAAAASTTERGGAIDEANPKVHPRQPTRRQHNTHGHSRRRLGRATRVGKRQTDLEKVR